MDFLGLLFGITDDKIKKVEKKEFQQRLDEIPELTAQEKQYLIAFFDYQLKDGLTINEIKERIQKLEHNHEDFITQHEIDELKKKLLGELTQK